MTEVVVMCETCGIPWCDACRIFGDRSPPEDEVSRSMKTHKWRCYGHKNIKMGSEIINRRYMKCTKCKNLGIARRVYRDTYPNKSVRWHPITGSVLAPCSA